MLSPETNPLLDKAQQVARAARDAGGRALLVGGYVRDALLNLPPKDADIEVYGIEAGALKTLLRRLGRVGCVGESFRVYKLSWHIEGERHELDISLPRRDRKTGTGHRGFVVEGDPYASVEDAARRRDFTVNAILLDPLSGEILDPFGGRADLEQRVLRVVDAAHFGEDSLRVLRAMQFAARFEMSIHPDTVALCRSIDLSDLPRERVWGEWEKMLLKAARPSIGLLAAQELGMLEQLFGSFELQKTMARRGAEMCRALDAAAREKEEAALPFARQVTLMLATMGVFIGSDNNRMPGMLDALSLHTLDGYDVRRQVTGLVELENWAAWWLLPVPRTELTDGDLRRISSRAEPRLLFCLLRALGKHEAAAWFIKKMESLGVADGPPALLLMGRHLLEMGLAPGPQIGYITRAVYEMQLDGVVTTLQEAQSAARQLMNET